MSQMQPVAEIASYGATPKGPATEVPPAPNVDKKDTQQKTVILTKHNASTAKALDTKPLTPNAPKPLKKKK